MPTSIVMTDFLDSITALAYALEARDKYTSGHSQRVAFIATIIAREMNLGESVIRKIKIASLVHDIGKIGIKESVLDKASFLSQEEFEIVKTHCEVGEHILSPVIKDVEILKMVRHHHERFDGKGYPDGLTGERIQQQAARLGLPESFIYGFSQESRNYASYLGASIIAVADSYDAMTTQRPYRDAMSPDKACLELRRMCGQQFDPSVVNAFLRFLNRSGEGILPEPGLAKFYLLK